MKKDILLIGENIERYDYIQRYFKCQNTMTNMHDVNSVKEALWKMQFDNYYLIILDVLQSGGYSCDTISILRKLVPMPILVLLENNDDEKNILMLKNGADSVLESTVNLKILFAQAEAMIRRYTELNYIVQNEESVISHLFFVDKSFFNSLLCTNLAWV